MSWQAAAVQLEEPECSNSGRGRKLTTCSNNVHAIMTTLQPLQKIQEILKCDISAVELEVENHSWLAMEEKQFIKIKLCSRFRSKEM
jgi:hypothetical protein